VAVERFDVGILPGCSWFDVAGGDACEAAPVLEGVGDESGPLSQRINAGAVPRRWTIRSSVLTVSSAPMRRAAGVARASRVYSSVTVRILIGRPSAVWSERKSSAQTWLGQAAATWPGIRLPRRRRRGLAGSRSPSSRHNRCTRLRLQAQPSRHRSAWMRR